MDELARLLDRERLLLELLVFKLVELRQLLLIGETRFLGWAAEEAERAVEAVRAVELERAALVQSVHGPDAGVDGRQPLAAIAAAASEPYSTLLEEDRLALLRLTAEVRDLLAAVRGLASAGVGAVADLLQRVDEREPDSQPALATYGPEATWQRGVPAPRVARTL